MSAPIAAEPIHAAAPVAASAPQMHARRANAVIAALPGCALLSPLQSIPVTAWETLSAHAIEPNACYLPQWSLAVANHARGHGHALALAAFDRGNVERIIGLMPVRWAARALSLPVPLLVSWNAYAPYAVPLLDKTCAAEAAGALIDAARESGAQALLLRSIATGGPAYAALLSALERRGLQAKVLRSFQRAGLDATQNPDAVLRDALSSKKLKELRRQRHRLEDAGPVAFEIASGAVGVGPALEAFLALEAKGWKGKRGTALIQDAGDAAFIREAAPALAARGQCQIVSLTRIGETLAAGLVLRDRGRAFFFKIAMDETEARTSPGVQLTLDLTKHLCADPAIAFADSTADGEHPMIDHIWRERIEIADVFIPLSRGSYASAIRALIVARYRGIDFIRTLRRIKEKLP